MKKIQDKKFDKDDMVLKIPLEKGFAFYYLSSLCFVIENRMYNFESIEELKNLQKITSAMVEYINYQNKENKCR